MEPFGYILLENSVVVLVFIVVLAALISRIPKD